MMKKKTLAAFAMGVATVATGMSSNVHADTTVTVTKENVGDQTKITTTTTRTDDTQQKIEKTKQQIASQQTVVNGDKSSILEAQSKVNQDVSNASDAQKVVTQKEVDLSKAQATVNAIQNKQQSGTNQIQSNSQLKSSIQSKINQDQNLISSQKKVVDQEQNKQLSAQQVNNQAQSNLINAQDRAKQSQQRIIDDQGQIRSVQQSIAQDNIKISDQQQKVVNDQQKINDDQVKINKSHTQLENDRKQLQNDQQILNSVNQGLTNADNAVNDTKNKLNLLQSQSTLENQIKIPNGYTTSLLNQVQEGDLATAESVQKQTINGILMNDHYEHNSNAAEEIVNDNDLTHLSSTDQIELNQYAANLINSVRRQMGLQPLTVTDGSIKLAQEVAEQYNSYDNNNGWNICNKANEKQFPHDIQGLKNAAKQNNMRIPYPAENASTSIFGDDDVRVERKDVVLGDLRVDYSIDPSQWGYDPKYLSNETPLTMDDLEENIYNTIIYMLFSDADSYFDHAKNFTEINGNMGVSFDNLGQLHIEFYSPADRGDLGDTPIPTDIDQSNLQQIRDLQNQLSQQQAAAIQAQKDVNAAQQRVNADQSKINQDMLTQLQQQLSNDQIQLSTDMSILNDFKKQLESDQQMLTQTQNDLLKDQSSAAQVRNKLAFAIQVSTTTQTNLNKINETLLNDQSKLNKLKQQLSTDQLTLNDLNSQQLQFDLQLAQRELTKAQNEYNNAVQHLKTVQIQTNHDHEILNQLFQKYAHDLKVLNLLEDQLKQEERTTTSSSVQWVKHPSTTAEIGNQIVLSSDHRNCDDDIEKSSCSAVMNDRPIANDIHLVNNKGLLDKSGVNNFSMTDAEKNANIQETNKFTVPNKTSDLVVPRSLNESKVKNALPQMGSRHSDKTVWGEILLLFASLFGILGLGKKRHNYR